MNETKTAEAVPGSAAPSAGPSVESRSIDTIRTLAMDAVQRAGSGHPGTAMALAPVAYTLWMRHMRYSPRDPGWFGRDRFVLSAGHAAILQYAVLHLTGFDLPLEEIRNFRRAGSCTAGHPEYGHVAGVETTTGPLGQGVANSVGMAIAEAHLAAVFNRPGHAIVDHRTYVICSDGDLMEGVSYEAASLAGHLGLGKLLWLYDDNRITIDGDIDLAFSEDVRGRFESLGWHVHSVGDANDLAALDAAIEEARSEEGRPSLIIVRSHIGYGAPNKQDTAAAHGAPLGEEEVRLTKEVYGWPTEPPFLVPDAVRSHMGRRVAHGEALAAEWGERFERYRAEHPELAAELERRVRSDLPSTWDEDLPVFGPDDDPIATRAASGRILTALAPRLPELIGGSADLSGSNNTLIDSPNFSRDAPEGRNLRWGIREHAMASVANGLVLHGGVRPYIATFFTFTDYARPSMRLAALMGLPNIYVMTHDSIGLGADGPTHQPIEHLASFRAMPGVVVLRPADPEETVQAWRVAIERGAGPTILVLTRQKVPHLAREAGAARDGVARGAYVLRPEPGPLQVVLLGTGSELQVAVEAAEVLEAGGVSARVVSFPSWELFRLQSASYRDEVLPPGAPRVAIEAGATLGWTEWVGRDGAVVGIDRFGQSASAADNFARFGFTAEAVVARALEALAAEGPR
ncbi:transketolase [Candidatus Palauibacter soopunensis]|uniref:transketolase n=1 Tax=Candidatus Palauibacter soopunensis TaxID=3056739 RepID=UPI0023897639|nr:transketolase [Candidatus Palauibacter soopunensis]MDE2879838.1 transketolase [Candidatus Palauibacter soopunensis]